MSLATLNVRMTPRRMLTEREAADYCGMSPKRFPTSSRIMPVDMPDGQKRYDIRDLDSFIDNLKTGAVDSDDDILRKLG